MAEKIVLLLIQTYLVVCKPDVAFYIVTWVEGFYQTKSASASMSLFNDNGLEVSSLGEIILFVRFVQVFHF